MRAQLPRLPATTRLVEIPGMEPGQFGAYDSLFGEGDSGISDATATAFRKGVTNDM